MRKAVAQQSRFTLGALSWMQDASKEDHTKKAGNIEIVCSFLFPAGPWPAFLKVFALSQKIGGATFQQKQASQTESL